MSGEKSKLPLVDLRAQHAAIAAEVQAAIDNVMSNTDFILGADVAEFESEFARYCDAEHCVGLDSGMSALELGMRAMGIGPGDEVITPAGSFIASSSAISFTGATPVWVDVDPKTYNIDPALIEAAITPRTKAIMAVHLYGQPADMDRILDRPQARPAGDRGRLPVARRALQGPPDGLDGRVRSLQLLSRQEPRRLWRRRRAHHQRRGDRREGSHDAQLRPAREVRPRVSRDRKSVV